MMAMAVPVEEAEVTPNLRLGLIGGPTRIHLFRFPFIHFSSYVFIRSGAHIELFCVTICVTRQKVKKGIESFKNEPTVGYARFPLLVPALKPASSEVGHAPAHSEHTISTTGSSNTSLLFSLLLLLLLLFSLFFFLLLLLVVLALLLSPRNYRPPFVPFTFAAMTDNTMSIPMGQEPNQTSTDQPKFVPSSSEVGSDDKSLFSSDSISTTSSSENSVSSESGNKVNRNILKKPRIILAVLIVVIVSAVAITYAATMPSKVSDEKVPEVGDENVPEFNDERLKTLVVSQLPSISTSLESPMSPESQALRWLAEDSTSPNDLSDIHLVQRFAMATLAFALNLDEEENWLLREPVCDWGLPSSMGNGTYKIVVECNEQQEVEFLQAYNVGAKPLPNTPVYLPASIGLLTTLDSLDISVGHLGGTIPSELALLTNLNWLEFNRVALTGTIPTEFGYLTDLGYLTFGNVTLSGTIPTELGELVELSYLQLKRAGLNGTIPTEVGRMTHLFGLELPSNTLDGTIPSEIGLLSGLHLLDLKNNNDLTGTIPSEIFRLTSLQVLSIPNTGLTGTMPSDSCSMFFLPIVNCGQLTCDCCYAADKTPC